MTKLNRREFLKTLALLAGSGLAACTSAPLPTAAPPPTAGPTSTSKAPGANTPATPTQAGQPPASATAPAEAPATAASLETPAGTPYLAVARNGDPETMVRRALEALCGMGRFVPQGADVIIKPNICVAYHTYEYAATTNPWVVGALVRLALEAGAKRVRVMDYPFGGTTEEAYAISGIGEQVQAAGGEMLVMPRIQYKELDIAGAESLKKVEVFQDALSADVLIDVPIAKDHSLAGLTIGMKNLMGLILNRQAVHNDMPQRLSDLLMLFKPTLTVVDAVRILMDHGPTGGDLGDVKEMNTIIASHDTVAADSYAASSLFGLAPEKLGYVKAAAARNLGRSDVENVRIEEINVGA